MDADRMIARLRAELFEVLEAARGWACPDPTYHQMLTNLLGAAIELLDEHATPEPERAIRVAKLAVDEWRAVCLQAQSSG